MVRTLRFHCRGREFHPWLEDYDPTSHSAQPKKRNNNKKERQTAHLERVTPFGKRHFSRDLMMNGSWPEKGGRRTGRADAEAWEERSPTPRAHPWLISLKSNHLEIMLALLSKYLCPRSNHFAPRPSWSCQWLGVGGGGEWV